MDIYEVIDFLTSDKVNDFLFPFKFLAALTAIGFVWGANYYYRKQELNILDWRRKKEHLLKQSSSMDKKTIPQRFQIVIECLNKKNQLDVKIALLKNYYLIQDILKELKIPEEQLTEITDEKLPNAKSFKVLMEIAEKVKNDSTYSVNIEKVRDLFISMRDSLMKIGVI